MTLNQQHQNTRVQGFTLLEMMTVTTILGIISAFAVPNLQGAKISSNEAGVVGSMRTLSTASELWRTRYGSYPGAFTGDGLAEMADPTVQPAPFIDNILGTGVKSDYTFTYTGTASGWDCVATPNSAGAGFRSFYVNQTGMIRVEEDFANNGPATSTSPAVD